jgi:uncharacterized membrane protein
VTSGETEDRGPVPWGWFVASIVAIGIAGGVGVGVYDELPAMVPTHWGFDGTADAFTAKSPWVIAWPLVTSIGVVCMLFIPAFLNTRVPMRPTIPSGGRIDPERTQKLRGALSALFGHLMFVITLAVTSISVIGWVAPSAGWLVAACAYGLVAVVVLVLVRFWVRWRRLTADVGAEESDGASDDRHWKAGVFYFDPANPAVLVPKRVGIGWTVNLGHPVGVAAMLVLLIGVIGLVVWGSTTGN